MMKILGASNVSSGAKFNLPYRTDLSCTQAILSAELHNTSISISSVRFLQALFLKLRAQVPQHEVSTQNHKIGTV